MAGRGVMPLKGVVSRDVYAEGVNAGAGDDCLEI